jgi:Ca2+-binding EF-hand superfamily protein
MNNNTLSHRVKLLNRGDVDRDRLVNRSIDRLKKEFQTIDEESDLTYEEINKIYEGFALWTGPVQYTARKR